MRNDLATRFDHLEVRIGNEIVLNQDELGGTPPLASTTNLLRATINSLLSVADAQGLTPDRVEHFTRQLAKAAIEENTTLDDAMDAATQHLSTAQRQHLTTLLNTGQVRGMVAGLQNIQAQAGAPLGTMHEEAARIAKSTSQQMSHLYQRLCQNCNMGELHIGAATNEGMDLVRSILVPAANEAALIRVLGPADASRAGQAQLAQRAVGLMTMGEARMMAGQGVVAVGQEMKAIPREEINREAISRRMQTGLQQDLDTGPDSGATSLGGLAKQFILDFQRSGIVVNGQYMGGQGSSMSIEEQQAQVQVFIDAVGGQAQAQQIARLAHQARMGDALEAFAEDTPGLKPLYASYIQSYSGIIDGRINYPISPYTGRPATYILSVQTQGEGATITIDWSEQQAHSEPDTHERGYNASMTFTLQGLGTQNPAVRLDHWDALFSSTPRRRIIDMDRVHFPSDQFAMDTRTQSLIAGQPPIDRNAITAHMSAELTAELQKVKTPGYRGLPDHFIEDFFRRPMLIVDGQPHGTHGGVRSFTEEQKHALLDGFINAVGGENRARHIATMAYQNMSGLMDESLRSSDQTMFNLEVAGYQMHPHLAVANHMSYTITTLQDGSVDMHLDYREQRGEANGYEFGKNGFLNYRLSNLDTDAPTVQLQDWDMRYATNAPRE
ncbi:MAG: hypothetical protein GX055_06940 [Desulfovibrionales bacterium]|nr:hypothetical protein [Desulfovibrionales bacterium]